MIFVFHIPKTAGSELFTQLKTGRKSYNYGPGDPPTLTREYLLALEREGVEVVRAHCDATVLPLLPDGTRVITMLRDPVDRIYSLFRHARQSPAHELAPHADTLETFLSSQAPHLDNAMTKRLSGIFYQDITPTESHVKQALDTLASFWHVGFRDTFGKTVRFINQETGWQTVNRGGPHREREYHAEMVERNQLDLDLYIKALAHYG